MKIRTYLNEAVRSEKELKTAIDNYGKTITTVEREYSKIKIVLDEIQNIEKSAKKEAKEIQKYMEKFNKKKVKANQWTAQLEKVLKYKVVKPDYKYLWEEAMSDLEKLNQETANLLKNLMEVHVSLKSQETKNVLQIKKIDEGLFSKLKSLWNKVKSLFNAVDKYSDTVDNLTDLRRR